MILVEARLDIKTYPLLRKLIKSLTVKHLKCKADIFSADEMKKIFTEMFNENEPSDLKKKVTIALLYYGLLQVNEFL